MHGVSRRFPCVFERFRKVVSVVRKPAPYERIRRTIGTKRFRNAPNGSETGGSPERRGRTSRTGCRGGAEDVHGRARRLARRARRKEAGLKGREGCGRIGAFRTPETKKARKLLPSLSLALDFV